MLTMALALMLSGAAASDDPMAAWMQCLANAAERFAATAEPTGVAAEATMGSCTPEENAVNAREQKGIWGSEARRRMDEIERDGRDIIRQRVVARIVDLRTK